jgi:hypothetical protein
MTPYKLVSNCAFSSDSIESMPDKSILQLRKYITVLTSSTLVSKTGIKGARECESAQTGEVLI